MVDRPIVTLKSITFSDGQKIELGPTDKVLIVGPNNSGKSLALRNIETLMTTQSGHGGCVTNFELNIPDNFSDLSEYLIENAKVTNDAYTHGDWTVSKSLVQFAINQSDTYFFNVARGFIQNLSAQERLNITNQQKSIPPEQNPSSPQHVLYRSKDLMSRISDRINDAFNQDIFFNYIGGPILQIHLGEPPKREDGEELVGDRYVERVQKTPKLDEQGDGIKSYVGILFKLLATPRDINLLDEPEAFLHPPQSRRLGKLLASEVDQQLIIATHNSDILRGFLEGSSGNIRILRLERDGNTNRVHEADPNRIREMWEKPAMRYTNALDAIFHEQAILCEAHGDGVLYNSMADYLVEQEGLGRKDSLFVPTGGKDGAMPIARALKSLGVPVKAVFDIDVLNDKSKVKPLVEAFDGDWGVIEPLVNQIHSAVENGTKTDSTSEIKGKVTSLLTSTSDATTPSELKKQIGESLRSSSPWGNIKRQGKSGLPSGDAQTQFDTLDAKLREIGIYVVSEGEIENFHRATGGHGDKFVNAVLSNIDMSGDDLRELREFVKSFW